VGAVRRLRPYGFAELPGNRLDDFAPENGDAPSALLAVDALPAAAPAFPTEATDSVVPDQPSAVPDLMVVVDAYPEEQPYQPRPHRFWRAAGESRVHLHLLSTARTAARAIVRVPLAFVASVILRLWGLAWWPIRGARRVVAGACWLVWSGLSAIVLAVASSLDLIGYGIAATTAALIEGTRTGALGIYNAVVRTFQLIGAGLGAIVYAVIASVAWVGNAIAATAAAALAFAWAVALSVRNAVARTTPLLRARLATIVQARLAGVAWTRNAFAATAAALVAFWRAAMLGLRNTASRTIPLIAAGIGACAEGVHRAIVHVQTTAPRTAAARAARARRLGHLSWDTATGTARLVIASTKATMVALTRAVVDGARFCIVFAGRVTAAGAARLTAQTQSWAGALQRAMPQIAAGTKDLSAPVVAGATSLSTSAPAAAMRLAGRIAASAAATASMVGTAVVSLTRSMADVLRPAPVLATGAVVEPDFTLVVRRAHGRASGPTSILHHDAPLLGVAGARVPLWARQLRVGPTLAVVVMLATGLSGGLLSMRPEAPRAASAPVNVAPPATAPAPAEIAVRLAPSRSAAPAPITRSGRDRAGAVPDIAKTAGPARSVSAARVRAIWAKTDTRSLDRALYALRSATMAFHRCDMQMTSDDRAVAHCDEVPEGGVAASTQRVAWTIGFRRGDNGWLIEDLSATGPNRRARRNP